MPRLFVLISLFFALQSFSGSDHEIGEVIDSFNGVEVFYNGRSFKNVSGRNTTYDGYNLGLKFQCVEFVKRYYYEYYNHKMPDSYGHAKDLYNSDDKSYVSYNEDRGLMQYKNIGYEKPQVGDILVYGPRPGNPFGHTGILIEVEPNHVTLLQQNHGMKTRIKLKLVEYEGIYTIADYDILGWLRMP